jgi:hypothetical protein
MRQGRKQVRRLWAGSEESLRGFEYPWGCNGRLGLWVYSTMNLMYSLRGRDGSLELSELREPE